jgi:hypothetical protein
MNITYTFHPWENWVQILVGSLVRYLNREISWGFCRQTNDIALQRMPELPSQFTVPHSTGCFKKNFTTLKADTNLFRGHLQCFGLS